MKVTPVEDLFSVIHDTATILQEELSITFLEALAETGENIFQQAILQEEISELALKRLRKKYESLNIQRYTVEEIRKSFQLAILKGMKESVQPNHQMTPDAVGLLIGYLVNKFVSQSTYSLFDPAIGTGNLLTTVINQQFGKTIKGIGVDIDELLLKLAYVNANLQEHNIQLFNGDSLEPLFIELADAVVSDLPVGYYPNDERASDYKLKAENGHSYAHHLFIEQSIKYTKDGGYLFFLVPNGIFDSEEAPKLNEFLKEKTYIQAILQLPSTMFRHENAAKSILILQKKGDECKPPKQVLLVNLPSLSNGVEVEKILSKMDTWLLENK